MEINVLVDRAFEGYLEASWLQSIAEQVLISQGASSNAELGLVVTSQEKVQELNRNYLGWDEPTDVLAFYMIPAAEETKADLPPFITPPDGLLHLGEVIISYPQAVKQAEERQHSARKEMAILIIHGVLHLLGYDHEEPEQQRQMSAREAESLSSIEGRL
ncbi:rRNA maturation RNase YbeY [Chloroflexota bacterium]